MAYRRSPLRSVSRVILDAVWSKNVQGSGPVRTTNRSRGYERLRAAGPREGVHTTHLSVVDKDGLAVAMTLSINTPFGSGLVVPGTGVLLNDEMDDFYVDGPNSFGLVGNQRLATDSRPVAPSRRLHPRDHLQSVFRDGPDRVPANDELLNLMRVE